MYFVAYPESFDKSDIESIYVKLFKAIVFHSTSEIDKVGYNIFVTRLKKKNLTKVS